MHLKNLSRLIFAAALWLLPYFSYAQVDSIAMNYKGELLLTDRMVQLESAEALMAMYNFNFFKAESEFKWFKLKHPHHPLPYFLLGLCQWWKIMPDPNNTQYDESMLAYMDTSIAYAKQLLDREPGNPEGHFFMAASHGFQGRLYSDREQWRKAAFAAKTAMNHMQESEKLGAYGIEFQFGQALYNYYSVWVPENYKSLKPIMLFFKKGDKQLGIKQLEEVATESFYTRTEAQLFLARIYAEEKQPQKAFPLSEYLYKNYPNNPYFARSYVRAAYNMGQWKDAQQAAQRILNKIDSGATGFEATSGRFAAFHLAYVHRYNLRNEDKALEYFALTKKYGEEAKAQSTGYYLYAVQELAKEAVKAGNKEEALALYEILEEHAPSDTKAYKEAKQWLKDNRKRKGWLW